MYLRPEKEGKPEELIPQSICQFLKLYWKVEKLSRALKRLTGYSGNEIIKTEVQGPPMWREYRKYSRILVGKSKGD